MIEPILSDAAFLSDVRSRSRPGVLQLWWLGQSGYLLHWNGRYAALDPYLSESLTRKYAATDKPHVRMTRRVVDPAALGFVDVVTSSHAHTDHLDPGTLRPMAAASPGLVLVCPASIRDLALERSGLDGGAVVGLDPEAAGGAVREVEVAGFRFHAVPAAHEGLDRDAGGRHLYLGYVIEAGPHRIYHSGDTLRYAGQEGWLTPWRVDVALLPINGRAPERRVAGNLDGPQAAELARDIGAGVVVPCHYDLFEFNTATPDRFVWRCQTLGQGYRILRAGEGMELG